MEAARAGEHGEVFAVVASELRKLAKKSKKAAEQIVGLGLSIVQGLVKMNNGKVWLDSKPGKESCFYFTFPMETQPRE